MQNIALLGSTGSIGEQTLDVVRQHPDMFAVGVLTANSNWQRLAEQAIEFDVDAVVIANSEHCYKLRERLTDYAIKVYCGTDSLEQVCRGDSVDVVVNAMVGAAGLTPSLAAVMSGKKLALANKESLVVAGELLISEAIKYNATIVPIDSEHSAILQCLMGEPSEIKRLIITASGGTFRNTPLEKLGTVTPRDALQHPVWTMGAKITVDSATMVNKGFEVIEAHHLFGISADNIEVVLHPQSVIHSMVEFTDGAIKAQMGVPDMRLPIQYALTVPMRSALSGNCFDFSQSHTLTFEPIDYNRYPALAIAYDVLRKRGTAAATMNGANEVAVEAFLQGRIGFLDIVHIVEQTLLLSDFQLSPSLEQILEADIASRTIAKQQIGRKSIL